MHSIFRVKSCYRTFDVTKIIITEENCSHPEIFFDVLFNRSLANYISLLQLKSQNLGVRGDVRWICT